MKLTSLEQDALHHYQTLAREKREKEKCCQQKNDEFWVVRERSAREFKQNIVDNAFRLAGIDKTELSCRQQKDSQVVVDFINEQKKVAQYRAIDINNRHDDAFSRRLERWKQLIDKNLIPPPAIVLILDRAAKINLSGVGSTSIASNQNIAQTKAEIDSGGYLGGPLRGDIVVVDWLFVWTPPRDGFLDVTSFLSMNGSSSLWAHSTLDGGSASSSVTAGVTLSQGNVTDHSGLNLFNAQTKTSWGHFLGSANFQAVDGTDTVGYQPTQFPVVAKIPIVITITASLYVLVQNAHAELDFISGDFRLNVPYVFLQLL